MKKRKTNETKESLEQILIENYMKLVEAVVINILERAKLPKSLKRKKTISKNLLKKKTRQMGWMRDWLKTDNAKTWFYFYEVATGVDSGRTMKRFKTVLNETRKQLKRLSTDTLLTKK